MKDDDPPITAEELFNLRMIRIGKPESKISEAWKYKGNFIERVKFAGETKTRGKHGKSQNKGHRAITKKRA